MDFKNEVEFALLISKLGGDTYLVGGAVRDEVINIEPNDRDYVITGLRTDDMPFARVVGLSFPVYIVKINDINCEVALARTEKKTGVGHRGFVTKANPAITIFEDLARRDLAINAMARHVLSRRIFDPHQGQQDIDDGVLRHVSSDAFVEDPLRVFRVARFASQFGFTVSPETKRLMRTMNKELPTLPAERVWKECEKALRSRYPVKFFWLLKEVGALKHFFPEVLALDVPDKHDGTALKHTMRLLAHSVGLSSVEQFALLVHDFGKGVTPPEEHPAHHGHDQRGEAEVLRFCKRLKVPNKFKNLGVLFAKEHMRAKRAAEMRDGKFLRWVSKLDSESETVVKLSFLDSVLREGSDVTRETKRVAHLIVLMKLALRAQDSIHARDLLKEGSGYVPGPKLGEALFQRRVDNYRCLKSIFLKRKK